MKVGMLLVAVLVFGFLGVYFHAGSGGRGSNVVAQAGMSSCLMGYSDTTSKLDLNKSDNSDQAIFKTGFEPVDPEFDREYQDGSLEVVDYFGHHGTHSLRGETRERFGDVWKIKDLLSGQQIVFVRQYVFFETIPTDSNGNMYCIYVRHYNPDRSPNYLQYAGFFAYFRGKWGIPVKWALNYGTNAGANYAPNVEPGPEPNKWYCIEVMVKRGTGNQDGELRVWVDGVEIPDFHITGIDNDSLFGYQTPNITDIWVGLGEGAEPVDEEVRVCSLYNDCVVISDSYVSPEPEDGTQPNIGPPSQEPPQNMVMPDQNVTVSVNITDTESGVKNATIHYNINNSATWITILMSYNSTSSLHYATIPRQPEETDVKYKIVAYDSYGNMAVEDNAGRYYVYVVIPEFPSALILPIFIIATLLAVIFCRRKRTI